MTIIEEIQEMIRVQDKKSDDKIAANEWLVIISESLFTNETNYRNRLLVSAANIVRALTAYDKKYRRKKP